jgi:hypothetical protein
MIAHCLARLALRKGHARFGALPQESHYRTQFCVKSNAVPDLEARHIGLFSSLGSDAHGPGSPIARVKKRETFGS